MVAVPPMVDKKATNGSFFSQSHGRRVEICFAIAQYSDTEQAKLCLDGMNGFVDYHISPNAVKAWYRCI